MPKLSIIYNVINEENVFKSGDVISGKLILEISKETKIDYLLIKAKGKARVVWSEQYGKTTVVYYDKEKFFKLEHYLIQDQKVGGGSVVRGGFHEYPFAFQIPMGNMPSSFKADFGKINYTLKAKLGRPMKVPTKAKTEFTFLSNDDIDTPLLMEPQFGERKEKMKVFTSGNIAMNIHTERMAYLQGEGLKVMVEIENNSSRKIVPKFSLYQKQSHFAKGKRRVVTKQILKEVGDPISASEHQSITRVLSIPTTVSPTIVNCKVLHVEYRMKVYLDISFAKDPEIKFPIVILPPDCNCGKMLQKWTPS
ncbi:hypothetical protein AGOR_G00049700 [Albula goreensis]|uniref:Arrestin C-terminal-like domain-containing protein n=1 Tax=Albula goreensis TaxID=1534307 RepID=A0A8T3DX60_9TELE|nr:hypothetical protein AGOR_G00049700 [Albula goreensis]